MKSDHFDIDYKGRNARMAIQFDKGTELFRFEWEDDDPLDFLYLDVKGTVPAWKSHTVLKKKDIHAIDC